MDNVTIGKFISQCRKEKELTQAQLAEMLDVSDRSVSRWETGKTMPDLSLYEPLCAALDIQVSELLYGKRMTVEERNDCTEKTALNLLGTKSQLQTLGIFTEILILIGIVISITLVRYLTGTKAEIIALVCGWFVWGFGLFLRVKIKRILEKMEK